jgi:hypothetical protein
MARPRSGWCGAAGRATPSDSHPPRGHAPGWTPLDAGVRAAVQPGVQTCGWVSTPEAAGVRCGVHCPDALGWSVSTVSARVSAWPCDQMPSDWHPPWLLGVRQYCTLSVRTPPQHRPARCLVSAAVSTHAGRVSTVVSALSAPRPDTATIPTADRTAGRPGRPTVRPSPTRASPRSIELGQAADGQSAAGYCWALHHRQP